MAARRVSRNDYRVFTPTRKGPTYQRLTRAQAQALTNRGYTVLGIDSEAPWEPLPAWKRKILDAHKET